MNLQKTTALANKLTESLSIDHIKKWSKEMIQIPSQNPMSEGPSKGFREKEIGEYYLQEMGALGLNVQSREVIEGRSNVFGILPGTSSEYSLMFAGHLDTVPTEGYKNPFEASEADGKIYGRGACDMKAAMACYLEVARLIIKSGLQPKGSLILCGVVDEEWRMIGSKEVGRNGPYASQCIIGEPSDLKVCPANKGQFGLFIRTFGKAVHSSIPEKGENAIERMAKVINALSDYNLELAAREPHPLCGHGKYSPGVIRGGDLVSAVPDFCELEIDRRLLPDDQIPDVISDLRKRIEPLKKSDPSFRYEISEPSWNIPANDVSTDEPVVQSLLSSYRHITGGDAKLSAFPGSTDAPNLGTPAVVCGPGSLAQAHSLNEYVEIEELIVATRMYLRAVVDLIL